MHGNNEENIFVNNFEFGTLALIANRINVGIIGGGKAGFIKAKAFTSRGFNVEVVSIDFVEEFSLLEYEKNFSKTLGEYSEEFLNDKHIVIVAINDDLMRNNIIFSCKEKYKLYIDCSDFKNGLAIVPFQVETDSLLCSVNSKGGNPRVTRKVSEKVKKILLSEENYVKFTTKIRNQLKGKDIFKEVMDFLLEDDFREFFNKGYGKIILKMFYDDLF
ncbi:NAD(P)-dependent oxidoreductase [Clostridium fallax]|uniref:precorrin-2 dehydrogenase n=1 Tax=Clostridium fallax TaxID=1533 RepID=A0A1M4VXK1_9CLOT|nr:NAD(P)-dependent oxidoreductase [Clostridium fallax]SHE73686.1 precorrin-2 dehydrogenase / sirohydrochlorin ferrochelatase [Clostridium fallax]SQB07744.1 precorrin-2 dehydrogenase [Clostridium fallax]